MTCYSDSGHGGCVGSRKSAGGLASFHGRHLIRAAASTQSRIATSGTEAWYYVLAPAMSVAVGVRGVIGQAGMALAAPLALGDYGAGAGAETGDRPDPTRSTDDAVDTTACTG